MCIRDRPTSAAVRTARGGGGPASRTTARTRRARRTPRAMPCLLYTSDAADERSSVDLGGRRIIKKKNTQETEQVARVCRDTHIDTIDSK